MIKLKYTINGAKFRLTFPLDEAPAAITRAEVLRENGIEVKVTGMPRRVSMAQALNMVKKAQS